ncbi:YibE/F family protein [Lentilactobacillus senioris]|uniref:YibE/F family protein n=1 Tax=Lentilactobacillus senioris TaxID=931534 RepID=UPI002282271A|nr:YibE/F family protein [Lentilactobacillus senioris]MCY9806455.1 YibE/F family protein [Lentilactobacillus senioris]
MKTNGIKQIKWYRFGLMVVLLLFSVWLVGHDDFLYSQPIVQIQKVTNGRSTKVSDEFNNQDQQRVQILTGKITNGRQRGKQVTIENTYSQSRAMDQRYHVGQKIFVVLHTKPKLKATIKDGKRDQVIWLLVGLAMMILLMTLGRSGISAIASMAINTVLFILALQLNKQTDGGQVLPIFITLAVVFAIITLGLVIGINRQMVVTLLAVVGATALAVIISEIVIALTGAHGVYYESMEYVTQPPKPLFLAEVIIGVLGAAMDVATDIIASLVALKQERPELSKRALFNSGRQIGQAIMGPLINVLFFIFMAETLPMTLIYLRNGNTWSYSFSMNMSLGMLSSLISAIGIVLTVLLASLLASWGIKVPVRKERSKWEQ